MRRSPYPVFTVPTVITDEEADRLIREWRKGERARRDKRRTMRVAKRRLQTAGDYFAVVKGTAHG